MSSTDSANSNSLVQKVKDSRPHKAHRDQTGGHKETIKRGEAVYD